LAGEEAGRRRLAPVEAVAAEEAAGGVAGAVEAVVKSGRELLGKMVATSAVAAAVGVTVAEEKIFFFCREERERKRGTVICGEVAG
jgi:hypothetical protein